MNFEEKNSVVLNAINSGKLTIFHTSEMEDNMIKNAIKKDATKFLLRTFIASIISVVVLVVLILLHQAILEKLGFVIIKYIIFIIPIIGILSPFGGIYNFINKNKLLKQKKYNCYYGLIEKYVEDKFGYKILGLNIDSIDFLLGCSPKEKMKPNDKVIVLSMDDSCYLMDINTINKF